MKHKLTVVNIFTDIGLISFSLADNRIDHIQLCVIGALSKRIEIEGLVKLAVERVVKSRFDVQIIFSFWVAVLAQRSWACLAIRSSYLAVFLSILSDAKEFSEWG